MDTKEKEANKSLIISLIIVAVAAVVLSLVGFLFLRPEEDIYQGQVEATTVRISGKLPGRVAELYVKEGDRVHKGDTLVKIYSSLLDAKLTQAEAMESAAASQRDKANAGARKQIVSAAYELWQQAKAAETVTKKTYERVESLFKQDVVSAQKRDEAFAAYSAAKAVSQAAKAKYDMAIEGAQNEDKRAAESMRQAAQGSVDEVMAMLEDSYLTAPFDGEISTIYPNESELVGTGSPIMQITDIDNVWFTFNVREESLSKLPMNAKVDVMVPALEKKEVKAEVYSIRDMGSYAVWSATKATGQYDSKTFKIKMRPEEKIENLRPGMSVILEK